MLFETLQSGIELSAFTHEDTAVSIWVFFMVEVFLGGICRQDIDLEDCQPEEFCIFVEADLAKRFLTCFV